MNCAERSERLEKLRPEIEKIKAHPLIGRQAAPVADGLLELLDEVREMGKRLSKLEERKAENEGK